MPLKSQTVTLVDKVNQIMHGNAQGVMDLVTKSMWGYDSKSTATGKDPDQIVLNPDIPEVPGFTESHVSFTFGRFAIPHKGHGRLFEVVKEHAGNGQHYVFASHTRDNKKNILEHGEKLSFLEAMFPDVNFYTTEGGYEDVRTLWEAIKFLENEGFTSGTLVVGQDRLVEFQKLLEQYSHEYNMTIGLVGVERSDGFSSSLLREAVENFDYYTFSEAIPDEEIASQLYDLVEERLDEIFDSHAPFKYKGEIVPGIHGYSFEHKGKEYGIHVEHNKDTAEVSFGRTDKFDLEMTHDRPNDAHHVIGTVKHIVKQHINKHPDIKKVSFAGNKNDRGRDKLYSKLTKKAGGTSQGSIHTIKVNESRIPDPQEREINGPDIGSDSKLASPTGVEMKRRKAVKRFRNWIDEQDLNSRVKELMNS